MILKRFTALMISILIITLPVVFSLSIVPGSVQTYDTTSDTVNIKWQTNVLADGRIEYGISSNNMNIIPETGAATVSHSVDITGLKPGTKYFYRAISEDASGPKSSDYESFTTKLKAPTGLKADELLYNNVKLSWSQDSLAVKYKVYKDGSYLITITGNEYSATGLLPLTNYSFQVSSIDSYDRESDKSIALKLKTPAKAVAISFIQVAPVTANTATIGWKTDESVKCTISYGLTASYDGTFQEPLEKTVHTAELTGLLPNSQYYYKIKCRETETAAQNFKTLDLPPDDPGVNPWDPEGTGDPGTVVLSGVIFSNIKVSDVKSNSVKISWETSVNSTSKIMYSMDDSFSQIVKEDDQVSLHEFTLTGLNTGAIYYFKVVSDDIEAPYMSFETIDGLTDFLRVDQTDFITNNKSIVVSGLTRPKGKVYIFVNEEPIAQVHIILNDTRFVNNVVLSPIVRTYGQIGKNKISVYSWDQAGNKDIEIFYVICDVEEPIVTIEKLPVAINKRTINISGITEPNATVEFLIKGRGQGKFAVDSLGKFNHPVNLGSDGKYNITVRATDIGGNFADTITTIEVDTKNPGIDFLTDIKGETHFKIYKIKGKTDPFASIEVINFGHYLGGCSDLELKTKYGGCDKFVADQENYDSLIGIIDPVTYGMGMKMKTTASATGEFEVMVSMIPKEGAQVSKNHILFNITDLAGNKGTVEKDLLYKPGCKDWIVGKIESYPFNVYTRELSEGNIRASAFFPINYLGSGTPRVSDIVITKDTSNGGLLMQDKNDMSTLIEMTNVGAKASQFDESKNQLYVHAPITIKEYRGSVDKLPDKLNAYLSVKITYETEYGTETCEVFPAVAFDVQKPELLTKWLSPEQINKTIETLDKMIINTKKIVDNLEKASLYGLIACGAMIATDYIKGFFGGNSVTPGETCTSTQEGMKNTYYVCDRILCPSVAPRCDEFTAESGGKYTFDGKEVSEADYIKNKNGLEDEYNKLKANDPSYSKTLQEYMNDPGPNSKYKSIKGSEIPSRFQTTRTNINGNKEDIYIDYYEVSSQGNIDGSYSPAVDGKGNVNVNINNFMTREAKDCKGGTLVMISKKSEEDGAGYFITGRKISDLVEVRCVVGKKPNEVGIPDVNNLEGCYNEACPQFDDTKCFGKAGIAPSEGLWSSSICVCLPGVMGHLKNWLKIMEGAKKCLEQARIGETSGGFCERLLAQFVCDIMIELFKVALSFADDTSGTGSTGGTGVRGVLSDYKTNSAQVTKSLSGRYGDVVKNQMGLATDNIVNKACVAAVSGDWSLIDGVLNNIVDAVEIEPIAHISGESRPYGHDPFTGRMNIGYNIYVGIVPGGETNVKVWMECDRNFAGGEYCGQNAKQYPLKQVPSRMTKNQPAFNENILFNDDNAEQWYNKVVMELEYEIAGEKQSKTYTGEIWRKGDLSGQCHFSIIGGISCDAMTDLAPNGIVELYSLSQGSKLSPTVPRYTNGDPVSALIKLKNAYINPFYIVVEYPGTSNPSMEYVIQPGTNKFQNIQYYNLWIDSAPFVDTPAATTAINNQWTFNINENFDQTKTNSNFAIGLDSTLTSLQANIVVTDGSNEKTFTCRLSSNLNANPQNARGVYYEGIFRTPTEMSDKDLKTKYCDWYANGDSDKNANCSRWTFEETQFERVKDSKIQCITKYDNFGFPNNGRVTQIKTISYSSPIFSPNSASNSNQNFNFNVFYSGLSNQKTSDSLASKNQNSGTNLNTNSNTNVNNNYMQRRTAIVNVYSDSNDNAHGDTPIVHAGGTGDQKITFTYDIGTPNDNKPKVEIIEPVGNYFNGDGKEIPIGLNVWNANKLDILVKARDSDYMCMISSAQLDYTGADLDQDCAGIKPGRTTYKKTNAPPFIEYYFAPKSDIKRGSTDYYEIIVTAKSKEGTETTVKRQFTFDTTGGLTQDDVKVCLGSGLCSGAWQGPMSTSEPLGKFNASGMPAVRTG